MNMAKLRQILELRRATKMPPLLPPRRSRRTAEEKKGEREILDIHLQLRDFAECVLGSTEGSLCCAFSESESENQKGPWKVTTASEIVCRGQSVELPCFAVEFQLERVSRSIRMDICDLLAKKGTLSIGYCMFAVSELVSSGGKIQRKVINDESGAVVAEAEISCHLRPRAHNVVLQFAAKNLSRKNLGNSAHSAQTFFEIHRMPDLNEQFDTLMRCNGDAAAFELNNATATGAESGGTRSASQSPKGSLLYRSEAAKLSSSQIVWRAFNLKFTDISRRELRLLCFSKSENQKSPLPPIPLGEFPMYFSVLRRGPGPENVYFLVYENAKKQKKIHGSFELCRLQEVCTPSFLEYVAAGSSIQLAFAIDFSRSEGSVHESLVRGYIEDVELAIGAFAEPLREFNCTNVYPCFGFGAKIPPSFRESQEFCLNLETDPNCRGIDAIYAAFTSSFGKVQPLNCAHLSHVIYYSAKLAQNTLTSRASQSDSDFGPPNYFVLVIVTRGQFDDLKESIQAIIYASRTPLSIIFVGIGNAQQLGELERLATAGTRLSFHGRKPERDCTQYVSVPECRAEESNLADLKASIAERGLSTLSAQFCSWMVKNGYQKVDPLMEFADRKLAEPPRRQTYPTHHMSEEESRHFCGSLGSYADESEAKKAAAPGRIRLFRNKKCAESKGKRLCGSVSSAHSSRSSTTSLSGSFHTINDRAHSITSIVDPTVRSLRNFGGDNPHSPPGGTPPRRRLPDIASLGLREQHLGCGGLRGSSSTSSGMRTFFRSASVNTSDEGWMDRYASK